MILSSLRNVATAIVIGIVVAASCVMTYIVAVGAIAIAGVANTLLFIPYRLAGTVLEQKVQSRSFGAFSGDVLGIVIAMWVIPALVAIAVPMVFALVLEYSYTTMRDKRMVSGRTETPETEHTASEELTPAAE